METKRDMESLINASEGEGVFVRYIAAEPLGEIGGLRAVELLAYTLKIETIWVGCDRHCPHSDTSAIVTKSINAHPTSCPHSYITRPPPPLMSRLQWGGAAGASGECHDERRRSAPGPAWTWCFVTLGRKT